MRLQRVVIFGATSAIAQAVARQLAARGARLHIVARDPAKLAAVRDDLVARGATVTTALADLDYLAGHEALVREASQSIGGLDAALIAQGVLTDQRECEADFGRAAAQWHTNFVAPASLATRVAAQMAAQRSGVIVAISSVAGDRGRASNYAYGSAKAALTTYLSGLRGRMHAEGVRVVTIKPGLVDTPMTAGLPKGPLWTTPDKLAGPIVAAMERAQGDVYAPRFWWAIMFVIRHLPERVFLRLKI